MTKTYVFFAVFDFGDDIDAVTSAMGLVPAGEPLIDASITQYVSETPMTDDRTPNFGGMPNSPTTQDRNFLDHYFASIHSKLEADALLFNRELPHAGLIGSENEQALANVIRQFLPSRFGVDVNAIVIDRFGNASKQSDIVIYDADRQASFFRKVHPVETVYGVIEVKTSMSSQESRATIDNLASVSALDFRPALTPYWQHQTVINDIHHCPPLLYAFSYRTDCRSFETFARWFGHDNLLRGLALRDKAPTYPEVRLMRICSLDQGVINMESTNSYIERWLAAASDTGASRALQTSLCGQPVLVDPAKSLFLFLQRLWFDLEQHQLHPGFDIRSYVGTELGTVIEVSDDIIRRHDRD